MRALPTEVAPNIGRGGVCAYGLSRDREAK
jgi:hypothetical protein